MYDQMVYGTNVFQEDLMGDETILWQGQPDPNILFSKGDIFLVPFSLLWGGFAIFWEIGALSIFFSEHGSRSESPMIFPLCGIPFTLMGLYFIFGRFYYKAYRKRNTFYAVTNKRILMLTKVFGRKSLQSIRLPKIPLVDRILGRNGTGSLVFGNMPHGGMYGNSGMEIFGNSGGNVPAFYDIKDVQHVYDLVNRLMEEGK